MSLNAFFKDKAYLIISSIFINIFIISFLFAVDTNKSAIMVVDILFWILIIGILIKEYSRRKVFYDELINSLESLDQKYLITEILKEPEFLDGQILFHAMRDIDKSMIDYVNLYKNKQIDYKEYIEMWVHEIKTPLAASKLIISNNANQVTKSIDEELDKLDAFVEQALFYARSSTLEKDYIIKETNLSIMINNVIKKHAKTFIYKNIKLDIQDVDINVFTDTKWVEFILDQIIGNAFKYIEEQQGIITIYAKKVENAVQLFIQDNGVGIEPQDLPNIFEKGFTGNNGRRNEKATGIGLYLCKMLCDKLYLDIQAESNNGTTIMIQFPINYTLF